QIRCIIKFCLLLLCFIQLQPQKAGAQPMLYQADSELRALFIPLFNPHPNVKFLYDMKAHIVDSSYFGKMVYDTSNAAQWYRIYEEMYYSAYDTTQFISADSVYSLAYPQLQSDTIGIGIIDWD